MLLFSFPIDGTCRCLIIIGALRQLVKRGKNSRADQ